MEKNYSSLNNPSICGIGHALMDHEFSVEDDFLAAHKLAKSSMSLVDQATFLSLKSALDAKGRYQGSNAGGSAANTIYGLACLGNQTSYVCHIAKDTSGIAYKEAMHDAGITLIADPSNKSETGTGQCLVMITPDGERTMATYLGIAPDISDNEISWSLLAKSAFLYIEGYLLSSTITTKTLETCIVNAKSNHTKIALSLSDASLIDACREKFNLIASYGVDMIFGNEPEALAFTKEKSLDKAAQVLGSQAVAFITMKEKGALVVEGEKSLRVPTTEVTPKDTNGAGDAFAAGVLHGILQGKPLEACCHYGNALAGKVIQNLGSRLGPNCYAKVLRGVDA